MQLPFSKQLLAAALVAIVAPSATVIGAQSFSEFVSQPRTLHIAEEFGPPPGGDSSPTGMPGPNTGAPPPFGDFRQAPPPGSQPGMPPGGDPSFPPREDQPFSPESQPPTSAGPQPVNTRGICPAMPVRECPPDMQSISETTPGGCSIQKCIPKGERGERKEERREERRDDRGRMESPPGLEKCARSVLGDAFDQLKSGGPQLSEDQKKMIHEKCGSFRGGERGEQPSQGQFPGRGEFRGQTPSGEFPGRGEGLDRAPGSGGFGPGGQSGDMMGPGGEQQRFGPSDEEMEKMEKERKTRMLQEMKRNLKGMEQGLRMIERGIKVCVAAKIDATAGDAALAKIKEVIAKVKTAEDPEELQDIMMDLPEHFDGARELVEMCHRLRELPRITKQLSSEVKRIEREIKSVTAQVKRSKLDLTDQLNDITAGLTAIKATLTEVGQVKTAEDFDDAMEKLESLRETFDELQEKIGAVRGVLNIGRGIIDAKREIRNAERLVTSLKRRKVDTTALTAIITEGKGLVAEIESLGKQKPLDPDAIHEKFEQLEDLGSRADEMIAKLQGKEIRPSTGPQFSRSPVEGTKLPDSFRQFSPQEKESANESSELESLLGF
ncbi:MAG: hypothetical protein Q7S02_06585 [bacterium]|nr:hypothetical protein [bacterium]